MRADGELTLFLLRKRRGRIEAEVRGRLGEGSILAIDEAANCFGIESRGAFQIRGNGCLGVSHDQVLFIMWLPRREILIRRERITGIERARSHLGKTVGRELLRVRFINDSGIRDSVAWWVRDLASWEAVLAA